MIFRSVIAASAVALATAAAPAGAVTNLIVNGSFEDGFNGFTRSADNAGSISNPAVVLEYNNSGGYGTNGGAYGEAVTPDNSSSISPDAVGSHGAYFVDDAAVNERISQLTLLSVGNYEIGFSAYLPANGAANPGEALFKGSIIQADIADFAASAGTAQNWVNYNGVAHISKAGYYLTSFTYNTFNTGYAKDIVIDRVYVLATTRQATVEVPPTPTAAIPEPAAWGLMIAGFAMVGFAGRRRIKAVAA